MFGDFECVRKDRWQRLWVKLGNTDRLRKYVASCIRNFFEDTGLKPCHVFAKGGEDLFIERL